MSILIKGMEMPKYGCDNCFLRTGNYCGRIEKGESVIEYARKNERHPNCPLIHVSPHGRLIDADAFKKYVSDGLETVKPYLHDEYLRLAEETTESLLKDVDEAPTVIPADEVV